ncbi:hypothetical protein B0J17DRAFT_286108 [Rhizoctonia solani]|nr:hypothetical protein B0J17DRAFT_286108 [Rhizoctonia solani]
MVIGHPILIRRGRSAHIASHIARANVSPVYRLTLKYKQLPYRVEYISYPDIAPKLKKLGVRAKNPTSFITYTLPMIADPSSDLTGKPNYVVDSFDIAIYLDKTYPAPRRPAVFPSGTRAIQKITSDLFTNQVGYAILSGMVPITARPGFPDERGREYFLRTREGYLKTFPTDTSVGSKFWGNVHEKWNWFGETLDLNEEGLFVMGKQISFTDFAIGGIISFERRVEGEEMQIWRAMSEWQGGRWTRYWAEIEKLEKGSSEVS